MALADLAARLGAYATAGRNTRDNQTAFAIHFLKNGNNPDYAEAYPGYFSSFAQLQTRREGPRETSAEFTPERYQRPGLTEVQQTLLDQAFLSLQDRFPNTAAHPTMDLLSIEEQFERGGYYRSRHGVMWRDLKQVFDNQEFTSWVNARETAAELAGEILQNSFSVQDPAAAAPMQYLHRNLTDWLSADREQFLSGAREQFQLLNDAMNFAEARPPQGPNHTLDLKALNSVMESAGLGASVQGVLLLTGENFKTTLESLTAANSRSVPSTTATRPRQSPA